MKGVSGLSRLLESNLAGSDVGPGQRRSVCDVVLIHSRGRSPLTIVPVSSTKVSIVVSEAVAVTVSLNVIGSCRNG